MPDKPNITVTALGWPDKEEFYRLMPYLTEIQQRWKNGDAEGWNQRDIHIMLRIIQLMSEALGNMQYLKPLIESQGRELDRQLKLIQDLEARMNNQDGGDDGR